METCPFGEDVTGVSAIDNEDIADDDKDSVQEKQANNGGVLGDNLNNGSNGKDKTWKGAPYPPTDAEKQAANDSKRKDGEKLQKVWRTVRVPGAGTIPTGNYPYTVAAHHLIPGNASLYSEENLLQNYMIKDKTVKAGGKKWQIKYHIGYNVNGAHNGVWLPGNYAIRSKASPTGVTWGKMQEEDWQLNYVAACSKVTKGQFHDTHEDYSDSVRELLNKIAVSLNQHQCTCKICADKNGGHIPPPYFIKMRLYKLSNYLRFNLTLGPSRWRRPWFASGRWRNVVFKGNAVTPSTEFCSAFNQARREEI